MEKPKQNPAQTLMEGLDFTDEDLEANREGDLSEAQRKRIVTLRTDSPVYVGRFLYGVGLIFLASFFFQKSAIGNQVNFFLDIGGLYVSLLSLSWFLNLLKWQRLRRDVTNGRAEVIEGRVRLDIQNRGWGKARYRIWTEDLTFSVREEAFLAFKNGDPYRLYYAPHSKMLLSAEWLRDEEL